MGKRYGQHFLHSPRVLDGIVAGAAVEPGEAVLEIGPGAGALTGRLLAAGARLVAVEVDPALCEGLRERFGGHPRFTLRAADILQTELSPASLFGAEGPYAVVANLPYYLSTPLLFRLIRHRQHTRRLVLMVQREIAARMMALPADGKAYGALSVAAHHAYAMERLMRVPPGAFRPPPRVDSAVVRLVPRLPVLDAQAEARFLDHVRSVFIHRRKRLLGNLRRQYGEAAARHAEALERLVGDRRPDALAPAEHLRVYRLLAGLPGGNEAPRAPG